jgi:hypothetical protein
MNIFSNDLSTWFPFVIGSDTSKLYEYHYGLSLNIVGAEWKKIKTGQNCLNFDGINDYIAIGDDLLSEDGFSFSVNIKPSSIVSTNYAIYSQFHHMNLSKVNLFAVGDELSFQIKDLDSVDETYTTDSSVLSTGWQNVVFTYNASSKSMKIYVNGFNVLSEVFGGSGKLVNNASVLGALGSAYSSKFNGLMNNVIVWRRELGINEIKDLYRKTYIE